LTLGTIKCAPLRVGGVPQTVGDHFICIGEAAGYVDPLTGGFHVLYQITHIEGIQYAMESAKAATLTLAEGFANDNLSKEFLVLYQKNR